MKKCIDTDLIDDGSRSKTYNFRTVTLKILRYYFYGFSYQFCINLSFSYTIPWKLRLDLIHILMESNLDKILWITQLCLYLYYCRGETVSLISFLFLIYIDFLSCASFDNRWRLLKNYISQPWAGLMSCDLFVLWL